MKNKIISDGNFSSVVGFLYADGGKSAVAMEDFMAKEPKTKEDFLNKMLSVDFSGDIRDLAADRNIQLKRVSANVLDLHFLGSGQHFQLVVRKPRTEEALEKMRKKQQEKEAGAAAPVPRRGGRQQARGGRQQARGKDH